MFSTSRKPASIADVAAAAGVSPTTVSHVISGKRPVNPETAELVHRAMRDLQYVPNRAAQSLRHGMSRALGLLVPDIANPYFAELARGAEDAAERRGFNLVLCNTAFDGEREARYLDMLVGGVVAGMIYAAGSPPDPRRLETFARTFPLVVVDEELVGVTAETVVSDNLLGGSLVGTHLLGLGHRCFLVIDGPERLQSAIDRSRGFRSALGSESIEIRHLSGDYRANSAIRIIEAELAAHGLWFSCVFAANDLMAIGAIQALRAAGYRIPDDVSVAGYDDTGLAAMVHPGLTTVRQPVYSMGEVGAERLAASLDGGMGLQPGKSILPVELVVRETTAPATSNSRSSSAVGSIAGGEHTTASERR